ncbi:hypothetical protein DKX38_014567 [Salix brachista]|uniref:HMA domain-containing protein n=1 Tax=Salix brachista TaxID=2182728 RepID=A0A5N5LFM4_9ROSI|nr:hypothetical protein DKX38_014567 [Salix brachista]
MGVLDHVSGIFDCSRGSARHRKHKQLQVELISNCSRSESMAVPLNWNWTEFLKKPEKMVTHCLFSLSGKDHYHKSKGILTVQVKVRIDCEGCERKIRRSLEGMKGVNQVVVDRKANKVTVVGYVEPAKVISRVALRTGKKAELWPYVPYDTVAHPYTAGVYDKKAPAGYVRNNQDPQVAQFARASSFEVRYTNAFSDENTSACAVM